MKKLISYFKSPSSDFALLVIFLILLNLVGRNTFIRFDATKTKAYSISKASKNVVSTLSSPLSIKVFFSDNLSAPYNSTRQYIEDLLVEYNNVANKNFSYSIMDMNKKENEELARDYGLNQMSLQEVKNNEVGFKNAYMGLAILYGDAIEVLDGISSTDGFEYKLTTTISKMISTASTLSSINSSDAIKLTLYLSDSLKQFQISGMQKIEESVKFAFDSVNKQNMEKLSFQKINPLESDCEGLQEQYGIQTVEWQTKDGTVGHGALGLVLEYDNTFRSIPLSVQRSLFGNVVTGLDTLEKNISDSLQSLLSNVTQIGYVTGHGEQELYTQQGQSPFSQIVSDMYELVSLNLSEDEISSNIATIIVNGPTSDFTENELYKIDQFIMRGGNAIFFVDALAEMAQQNYYSQASMLMPNENNISKLLHSYGVEIESALVLDENCYKTFSQNYGNVSLYWVPTIGRNQLAKKHPVTNNLDGIFFIQASPLNVSKAKEMSDLNVTELVFSSDKSWVSNGAVSLDPLSMNPPSDKNEKNAKLLATIIEGSFSSAFDSIVVNSSAEEGNSAKQSSDFLVQSHLKKSVQRGKIFVAGSSSITGSQVSDGKGAQPVEMFVRNVIDYFNGNEELCAMRTKGSLINLLHNTNSYAALLSKYFNEFGLTALTILAGFFVWSAREKRRKKIHDTYNPDDKRVIKK